MTDARSNALQHGRARPRPPKAQACPWVPRRNRDVCASPGVWVAPALGRASRPGPRPARGLAQHAPPPLATCPGPTGQARRCGGAPGRGSAAGRTLSRPLLRVGRVAVWAPASCPLPRRCWPWPGRQGEGPRSLAPRSEGPGFLKSGGRQAARGERQERGPRRGSRAAQG